MSEEDTDRRFDEFVAQKHIRVLIGTTGIVAKSGALVEKDIRDLLWVGFVAGMGAATAQATERIGKKLEEIRGTGL